MKALKALEFPLYQPIETSEFAYCSAQQPCQERYELIEPHLLGTHSLLDIGCHTGWFCRAFSRFHLKTIGIDRSPEWLAAAKELHPDGDYRLGNVAEMQLPAVDAVLCLSVAMYFGDDLWPILRKISEAARVMFFDFGGQYASSLPFNESTVIDAVLAETAYRSGILLGRSAIGRPLYMFRRNS